MSAKAAQLNEITVALRIGRHMHEHELLKEIQRIVAETGAVPDVLVIPPGGKTPAITRRTLTVRIGDHSPVKDTERRNE